MVQTSIQQTRTIRRGSAKFEVSPDGASWTDLGAMRDVVFREEWTDVKIESHNAGVISVGIRDQKASLEGSLLEINLQNLHQIRGGIDTYSVVAGSKVEGEEQVVFAGHWNEGKATKIAKQNGNKSLIVVNSVTGTVDGALVAGTTYTVTKDINGNSVVTLINLDSEGDGLTTENQNLTIDYDYTPATAKVLESGGKTTMESGFARITNYDADGKALIIEIFKATSAQGIVIEFPSDEADDVVECPIRLEGVNDTSRDLGKQLFKVTDEQSA